MSAQIIVSAEEVHGVFATRYLSVAALTVLLWDHCVTFSRERRFIWRTRSSFIKWAFLANRYLVPILLTVYNRTLSGMSDWALSTKFCQVWIVLICFTGIASMSISNCLVLLKVTRLWNGNKEALLATIVVYLITQGGSIIIVGFVAHEALPFILIEHHLKMCTLVTTPTMLRALWALSMIYDIFVFLMVLLNALSRPRGSHTLLTKVLYRDGLCFFMTITALRLMNLILAILAPASLILLGVCLIWALVTLLVSRMIINLQEAENIMAEDEYYEETVPLELL